MLLEISAVEANVCVSKHLTADSISDNDVFSQALNRWIWTIKSQGFVQRG
jgi:hypothetical protein